MTKTKILILSAILLVIIGGAVYGIAYKLPSRTITWNSTEKKTSGVGDFLKNLFVKSDISIVVFGKPGYKYTAGALADTIMVVHFDPDTNTMNLISLPRDLWISDESEQFKMNEVFHKNKVPVVMGKIEEITGLPLNGYVSVDLDMLKEIIDWLGGVDIVLKEPATDWVTNYTLQAGPQHLNGEDAIWLVRNRYNKQGDFFRESNQHLVIESMLNKFQQLSDEQKNVFMKEFVFKGSFLENVQVDLSKLTPYLFGTDVSDIKFKSIVLDFTTKLFKTMSLPIQQVSTTTYISVLIPTEGFEKYDDIRAYIEKEMGE